MTHTTEQLERAPAEIWAFYEPDISSDNCGADIIAYDSVQHGGKRYVRADIYDAAGDELIAARKRIAELERLMLSISSARTSIGRLK